MNFRRPLLLLLYLLLLIAVVSCCKGHRGKPRFEEDPTPVKPGLKTSTNRQEVRPGSQVSRNRVGPYRQVKPTRPTSPTRPLPPPLSKPSIYLKRNTIKSERDEKPVIVIVPRRSPT